MKNTLRIVGWIALLAVGGVCMGASYRARVMAEQQVSEQASLASQEARHMQQEMVIFSEKIVPARHPFNAILQDLGITADNAARLTASAQSVFDLRRLRAGNKLSVGRTVMGELRAVKYRIDAERVLLISPKGNDFHSEIETIPSETEMKGVAGEIHGSLFESVIDAGEKPELAMRLAEIFGWDLDFYTDPRPGDTFRVVVEKKMQTTLTPEQRTPCKNVEISFYSTHHIPFITENEHP